MTMKLTDGNLGPQIERTLRQVVNKMDHEKEMAELEIKVELQKLVVEVETEKMVHEKQLAELKKLEPMGPFRLSGPIEETMEQQDSHPNSSTLVPCLMKISLLMKKQYFQSQLMVSVVLDERLVLPEG